MSHSVCLTTCKYCGYIRFIYLFQQTGKAISTDNMTVMSSLYSLQYLFKNIQHELVSQSVSRLSRSCLMYVEPLGCWERASRIATGTEESPIKMAKAYRFLEHFQTGGILSKSEGRVEKCVFWFCLHPTFLTKVNCVCPEGLTNGLNPYPNF